MALEARKRRIGRYEYEVTQLPAPDGRRLLLRLYKALGPAIGAALKGIPDGNVGLGDVSAGALGEGLQQLAHSLTEEDFEHVYETLARTTCFDAGDGKKPYLIDHDFDHWSGRYQDMFKWLAFALEVNYAGFFGGLGTVSAFASRLQATAPASPSPSTSTGTSTGSPAASITP